MPEFTTHYLFGKSILEDFPPEITSVIHNNLDAFKWGLQGPDLLFYSRVLVDNGRLAKAATALHHVDPEALFSQMLDFILEYKGRPGYDSLRGYLYGFVCHYALDSTVHPYVYYMISRHSGPVPSTRHVQVESDIGSLFYRRVTGMPVSTFKIYEHYRKKGDFVEPVAGMYVRLVGSLLDRTLLESEVKGSFSACLWLNRFTYLLACKDLGAPGKTAVLNRARSFVMMSDFLYSFVKKDDVKRDAMNLIHNEWYNLRRPDRKFSYSFPELFEMAKDEALELSKKCCGMLQSGEVCPLGVTEYLDSGEPQQVKRARAGADGGFRKLVKSRA